MAKVRPITPAQANKLKPKLKTESLPEEVILSFNELIAENWDGKVASFDQETVIQRILSKINATADAFGAQNASRSEIFAKKWLDVESIYEKAGWKIEYDKPGYNESYSAIFKFIKND